MAASTLLAAFALLAGSAAMSGVSAQSKSADARWQPWLGCWEPAGAVATANGHMLCVLPVEGSAAVELATVDSDQVLAREKVVANGEQMKSDQSGCTGWKSATWSPDGEQLYLKSDFDCGAGLHRKSTGIFAMAPGGVWLDVQGVSTDNDEGGVRVIRYRSAPAPDVLRDELARVTAERELALSTARTAAAGSVSLEDVVNASRAVDPGVVEAWLIERRQKFAVDSKQLVQLADARVPSRVIDAMVALSYPKVFAVAGSSDIGMRPDQLALESQEPSGRTIYSTMMYPYGSGYYGYGLSPFDYLYSPYGYSPYGFGFGYGYGWYPGNGPVVIIRNPDVNTRQHGRVVNGRGYVRGGQSGSDGNSRGSTPRRSRGDWPSTNGTSSQGGSSVSSPSSGSTSSGQSTGRTAKPRKP